MAISFVHYTLLKEHALLLKRGGSLLEIGEANWYGDADPGECIDFAKHMTMELPAGWKPSDAFETAKFAYQQLFAPSLVHAVDLSGTALAFRQDLNGPLDLPRRYDVVINHGTIEHVFNVAQVFASIHAATVVDGVMIHECPFQGWPDHGFYCLHPTLFYDLSHANGYELISLSITEIQSRTIIRVESREHCHKLISEGVPQNALLFVVMRKTSDGAFKVPMQGYYDQRLSAEGRRAWECVRG